MRLSENTLSSGVDLARNFGFQWNSCPKITSTFSTYYPGPEPFSENETIFIRDVLLRYKDRARAYLSIRTNGHSLLYPFSYANVKLDDEVQVKKFAYEVTNRVNQRAGVIETFTNESIFTMNGKARCGSSIDYAYDIGIHYSYEFRVFNGRTSGVMSQFQTQPRGYHSQLVMGYLSGVKKVYDLVLADKPAVNKDVS